jgi:hypothetical protein
MKSSLRVLGCTFLRYNVLGIVLSLATGGAAWNTAAVAQDFSANKSPQQLFAGDCAACHRTPQGLAKGRDARQLADFLREHYTTGPSSASLLSAYLAGGAGGGQVPANARARLDQDANPQEEPKERDKRRAATEPNGRQDRRQRAVAVGEPNALEREKPNARRGRAQPHQPAAAIQTYVDTGESAKAALTAVPAPAPADPALLRSYATVGETAKVEKESDKPVEPGPPPPADAGAADAKPADKTSVN